MSEASVIAERANLFAEVKRQLHSVQGQTNTVSFAAKRSFVSSSLPHEKRQSFRIAFFWLYSTK